MKGPRSPATVSAILSRHFRKVSAASAVVSLPTRTKSCVPNSISTLSASGEYRMRASRVTAIHPRRPIFPIHSSSRVSGPKRSSCRSTRTPAARRVSGNCRPKSRSVKNTSSRGSFIRERVHNLLASGSVILREIGGALARVNPVDNDSGRNAQARQNWPSERNARIEHYRLGFWSTWQRREKAHSQPLVPLNSAQQALQDRLNTELSSAIEVDELPVALEK